MKKRVFISLLLFGIGGVLSGLFWKEVQQENCITCMQSLGNILSQNRDWKSVFWNVLWERVKQFLSVIFAWLVLKRQIAKNVVQDFILLMMGCYFVACVKTCSFLGICIFFISLFPHGIIYATLLFFLFQMESKTVYVTKKERAKRALSFLVLLILFLVGCFLEATASVWMLRQFYACLLT